MAKMCVVHPDRSAVTHCYQCHKPICQSCVMVAPHGSFCSAECSVVFREFRERFKESGKRKSGTLAKVMAVSLFLIAAVVAVHVLAEYAKIKALKSVDLIGMMLDASKEAGENK